MIGEKWQVSCQNEIGILRCQSNIYRKEVIRMAKNRKTGKKAASAASRVLRDGRTSKASKIAAASALSQRAPKSGNKK